MLKIDSIIIIVMLNNFIDLIYLFLYVTSEDELL